MAVPGSARARFLTCQRRSAAATQNCRPSRSTAVTQPQLHPALPRLSAMISQYFSGTAAFTDCSGLFAARLCSRRTVCSPSAARTKGFNLLLLVRGDCLLLYDDRL